MLEYWPPARRAYASERIMGTAMSWGLMIADGRDYLASAPWVVTFPGLALCITILSMNTLASYMRLVTDPVQRSRLQAAAAKE